MGFIYNCPIVPNNDESRITWIIIWNFPYGLVYINNAII
jgi:hypothetical protein